MTKVPAVFAALMTACAPVLGAAADSSLLLVWPKIAPRQLSLSLANWISERYR